MKIERSKPSSRNTEVLHQRLNQLYGPCIHCQECHGMCPSLIEALVLPDLIVKKEDPKTR